MDSRMGAHSHRCARAPTRARARARAHSCRDLFQRQVGELGRGEGVEPAGGPSAGEGRHALEAEPDGREQVAVGVGGGDGGEEVLEQGVLERAGLEVPREPEEGEGVAGRGAGARGALAAAVRRGGQPIGVCPAAAGLSGGRASLRTLPRQRV